MLEAPLEDEARLALDRAVLDAARARIAAGARGSPDADAIALRALLSGVAPAEAAALRALWGRIDAQLGPRLTVCGPAAQLLAADRFGLIAQAVADPLVALAAARDGARVLLDIAGPVAWWGRLLATPELGIVAALPDNRHGVPRALMISRQLSGPTGDDRTFWVTDSPATDARIVEALGQSGLAATPLTSAGGLKLFVLAGYVQVGDARLTSAPGRLSGVIGAAPLF